MIESEKDFSRIEQVDHGSSCIVVYVTDAKSSYAKSALNILGQPEGAHVKLRYNSKWISRSLVARLEGNSLSGRSVVIFFMSGNTGDLSGAKVVPLRLGTVVDSELVDSQATITVNLHSFVHSMEVSRSLYLDEALILSESGPRQGIFVCNSFQNPTIRGTRCTAEAWSRCANALSMLPCFEDKAMLYVESLKDYRGQLVTHNNLYTLLYGKTYRLTMRSLSRSNASRFVRYELTYDTNVFGVFGPNPFSLDMRIERFEWLLTPRISTDRQQTALLIKPLNTNFEVEYIIPIVTRTSWLSLVASRIPIGLSSAAIAASGLLPLTMGIEWKILLALIGSIGMAFTARR